MKSSSLMYRRAEAAILAASVCALAASNSLASPTCPSGPFGIAAQIVRVDPPGAVLSKRLLTGAEEPIGTNGVICAGESLEVRAKGGLRSVEVYAQGHKEVFKPEHRFQTERGVLAHTAGALKFFSEVIGNVGDMKPPPSVPKPTAIRSGGSSNAAGTSLSTLRALRGSQQYKLLTGVAPVLAWRGGTGPYRCIGLSDVADEVARKTAAAADSWCVVEGDMSRAALLQVRDELGGRVSWNIALVGEGDVPRPQWLRGAAVVAPADRAAWAVWLWTDAGDEWRLVALAMLHQLAPSEWVAGFARDHMLAETSAFEPR